jgi:hypothetical protein
MMVAAIFAKTIDFFPSKVLPRSSKMQNSLKAGFQAM